MAIQFVGGAINAKVGATSGTSTIALNSGLTGGIASSVSADDLVIAVFATGSTADRTLSITSGYTLINSELYVDDTFDTNLRVMYKFMGSTPDTETTFGPTGSTADAGAMAVYVFRGVDKTTPLDVAAVPATVQNTGIVTHPAITPTTSGAFIVCVGATAHNSNVDTYTVTDLIDLLTIGINDTNDITLGVAHKDDWTSGTFTPAVWGWTASDSAQYSNASMTIALRPAAGGSVATSAGTSTASAVGASNKSASASSAGSATASATGSAQFRAVATSDGVATASAVGVAQYLTVGTSAGTATATATGAADFRSVGTSAGLSEVSGNGAALSSAVASAAGTSTASAVGDEEGGAEAVATSTAGATVSGVGAAQFAAVGTSSGSASVSGATLVNFSAVGLSQGIAAANAVGAAQALSVFSAAGLATVNGVSFTPETTDGIMPFYRRRRR